MNKKRIKELVNQYQLNCDRIREIADTCESEKRDLTAEEKAEYEGLKRENQFLSMRMTAMADATRENFSDEDNRHEAERIIRENVANGVRTTIFFKREVVTVADADKGGLVNIKIQDILMPLQEGLIIDKIGLPLMTGLSGYYVWPNVGMVEATIAGEGVELSDQAITLDNLRAQPDRVGVAIMVTRQSINQTDGLIETIVKQILPKAVAATINKVMFSTTKVNGATNLVGPFVGKAAETLGLSFIDFNSMKAKVLATGVEGEGLAYVMTKATKAILEGTPKDAGSGIMLCENDTIAGVPVFTTNFIGEGNVGCGDWSYQPLGMFGELSFIVDPYSKARKDAVDFVLNGDFGTKTLRPEAFVLGKISIED
jgi:HK97 family phage major capsid protein